MLETASLNEGDLAAYCRSKGRYVEQTPQCRAQGAAAFNPKSLTAIETSSAKRIQLPGRELAKVEKAQAGAAALMNPRKKRLQLA